MEEIGSESDENRMWDPCSTCESVIEDDSNNSGIKNDSECESMDLEFNSTDCNDLNIPNPQSCKIVSEIEMTLIWPGGNNKYEES